MDFHTRLCITECGIVTSRLVIASRISCNVALSPKLGGTTSVSTTACTGTGTRGGGVRGVDSGLTIFFETLGSRLLAFFASLAHWACWLSLAQHRLATMAARAPWYTQALCCCPAMTASAGSKGFALVPPAMAARGGSRRNTVAAHIVLLYQQQPGICQKAVTISAKMNQDAHTTEYTLNINCITTFDVGKARMGEQQANASQATNSTQRYGGGHPHKLCPYISGWSLRAVASSHKAYQRGLVRHAFRGDRRTNAHLHYFVAI